MTIIQGSDYKIKIKQLNKYFTKIKGGKLSDNLFCKACPIKMVMIREFKLEDSNEVIQILKEDYAIDDIQPIIQLQNSDKKVVVYDREGIKGIAYAKMVNKEAKTLKILIYVEPCSRCKGIGTALYEDMMKYSDKVKPHIILSHCRGDKLNPTSFYNKRGLKKWYVSHDLCYKGIMQPGSNVEVLPYEEKYYEQYARGMQDSFYEQRRENDFKPYRCFEDEENRQITLNNTKYIYVVVDSEQVVASVLIKEGQIDDVFVIPSYQGKGYGRMIMQFAINKAINECAQKIKLNAVEWNTRAVSLYKSLGFEVERTTHYFRQYTEK